MVYGLLSTVDGLLSTAKVYSQWSTGYSLQLNP